MAWRPIVTGAAGTLGAGPAERPIYLSFTPNFSAVRMGPKPSSGHRLGLGYRTAENPGTKTDVRFLPDCVRCTFGSRRSSPDGVGPLVTRRRHTAPMDSGISRPYNLTRRLL